MNLEFIKKNNFLIYSLALLPLLSLAMVSIAIVLFALGAFITFKYVKNNEQRTKSLLIVILTYGIFFLLYVISLLWTDDLDNGLKIVGKIAAFAIIPVIVFVLKPFKKSIQLKSFYRIFIFSSVLSVIITIFFILFNIDDIMGEQNKYFANIKLRQIIEQVPLIGEHPIYFSLLNAVALLLLFYNRFNNNLVNITFYLILTSGILIASTRGVMVASFFVIILIAFQNIKKRNQRYFFVLLFLTGIGALSYFSPIKTRIKEITETKYIYPEGVHFNSFNLRMAIYKCTLSIIKEEPIIGYGPGDVQKELNECYQQFETEAFVKKRYNTHNQYFDYLASFGVIGLAIILYSFFFYAKVANKADNRLYLNFLILFYIAMLTENILVRNTGIVLFVTMNCIMSYPVLFKGYLK